MILDLAEELRPFLERPTRRHGALPVVVQLTNALRLFAKGDFQSEVADIELRREKSPDGKSSCVPPRGTQDEDPWMGNQPVLLRDLHEPKSSLDGKPACRSKSSAA
ncbi:unnamed protein product [Boreogadus saida]